MRSRLPRVTRSREKSQGETLTRPERRLFQPAKSCACRLQVEWQLATADYEFSPPVGAMMPKHCGGSP